MDDNQAVGTQAQPVASRLHSLVFLLIAAAVTLVGYLGVQGRAGSPGAAPPHRHAVAAYVSAAVLDWLLVWFAWKGIRRRGVTIGELVGGRWASWREALRDAALAALFWGAMLLAGLLIESVLGGALDPALAQLLPRTPVEVAFWAATCASAGFCEEFVFRGYAQRQLLALTGSVPAAVAGQAAVFAVMHAYQGWKPVLEIAVLGVMFGALAAWRRTLRVGMIAHGWHDLWEGWLTRVVFP